MKINLNEIQQITELLLEKLKQSKGNEIELHNDYYWDISMDNLYNPYEEPKKMSLGQLSDDLTELKKGLNSDTLIAYDLKRLSNILKSLSAENQIAF